MRYKKLLSSFLFVAFVLLVTMLNWYCSSNAIVNNVERTTYAGLSDSAKYVGMNTCKGCHTDIHSTFVHTGMGLSFDSASTLKSSANFTKGKVIEDKFKNLYYYPHWKNEKLFFDEFRLDGKDTIYKRSEQIKYIVGSGQHTNSHIWESNGYLFQAPLTFYTQKQKWDLPPGFENGNNTRFNRMIGLECMSCHNGYPKFVEGSENKYEFVKNGIDCERCHGPGSIHVSEKSQGIVIDTSKYIDFSIVNPSKLPIDLQFDVCQRCHIQGNAVLNEGKSFFDFKPGMHLSDIMNVFMPVYSGKEDEHIMASHAERLKLSKCFISTMNSIESDKNNTATILKPYKNGLTCITCHNPHVSVKQTNPQIFNQTCISCHQSSKQVVCSEDKKKLIIAKNDCVKCHMNFSGATDIPHVSVHDHKIAIPNKTINVNSIKKFVGINAINNPNPSADSKAQAYINYFEKFQLGYQMLDSALYYLSFSKDNNSRTTLAKYIQVYYLKRDFKKVIELVNKHPEFYNAINIKQYDNYYAWTSYRVGESFQSLNDVVGSFKWFERAYTLAPLYHEFTNKYANSLVNNGKILDAKKMFLKLTKEHPEYAPGFCNLGFVILSLDGNQQLAMELYNKSLELDPDYVQGLLNKAGLLLFQNNKEQAIVFLKRVIKLDPENSTAKRIFEQLKIKV